MRPLVLAASAVYLAACGGSPEGVEDAQTEIPQQEAQQQEAQQQAPLLLAQANPAPALQNAGGVAGPRALPAGVQMLQRASIPDPGVIAPTTAMTALVPAGWSSRGGVVASQDLCAEAYGVNWSAVSPDGLSSVSIFPTEVWQWSNTGLKGNCKQAAYASVRDYLVARIQSTVPGARFLDYRPRPDLTQSTEERARIFQAGASASGMTARADGGEILFAFMQNGVDMRGTAAVTAIFYEGLLQNPTGGPPLRTLIGATKGSFAATAPNGKLDFDLTEASRRSISPNPDWLKPLFALNTQLGRIAADGTSDLAAIIVAGGAAATQANIRTFEQMTRVPAGGGNFPGDAASDRMQRESIEAIRGVETYHDPVDNHSVQLDANYDHAWRVTNQDAYILTKDPNFNPGQYGIEATQMGVVQ